MSRAIKMIEKVLETGSLTEEEHDKIMQLIHKDGVIDEDENKKLSELFSALQTKNVIFSGKDSNAPHSSCANIRNEALSRDLEYENPKPKKDESAKLAEHDLDTSLTNSLIQETPHESETLPETPDLQSIQPLSQNDFSYLFGLQQYESPKREETFYKANDRMLDINLEGRIWMKTGSMVAYNGAVKFRREGISEHGLGKLFKRGVSGENTPLTAAEGMGSIYLADQGKKICVVTLKGAPVYIQADHILAFEDTVKWDIQPLFNIGTAMAGGLFHICFSGHGTIAFTTEFDPIVLRVAPGGDIMTDAKATVGWSSGVIPSVRADVNLQTLIGRGSGDTFQLKFEGDGIVIIQPFEDNFEKTS